MVYGCHQDAIVLLNEIDPSKLTSMFDQRGIQEKLEENVWIIHSRNGSKKANEYFEENSFRLGLNAQIFFIKSGEDLNSEVTQIIGQGTKNIGFEVDFWFDK